MTKCETVPLSQNGNMLDLFKQTAWCPGLKQFKERKLLDVIPQIYDTNGACSHLCDGPQDGHRARTTTGVSGQGRDVDLSLRYKLFFNDAVQKPKTDVALLM